MRGRPIKRTLRDTEACKSGQAQKKAKTSPDQDDPNLSAFAALQEVVEQTEGTEKDPIAVLLGRRGGLKGGRARADKLTPTRRRQIAKKAAAARWKSKAP